MSQRLQIQLDIVGPETKESVTWSEGAYHIGRSSGNQLILSHNFVSSQHARIEASTAGWTLTDMNSTNGTLVDGATISPNEPVPLQPGTQIRIGPFAIVCKQILVEPGASVELELPEEPEDVSKEPMRRSGSTPVPPKKPPPSPNPAGNGYEPLPGLDDRSIRLLNYLPGIYHTDFMSRFLALFEAILLPIEWNIESFDLYLHPATVPVRFFAWLAAWFGLVFDATWSERQRRTFLNEAHRIYARRGTKWALRRVLEIYIGREPEIIDLEDDQDPFTFTVKIPLSRHEVNDEIVEQLIDGHKPAHTSYRLLFAK